MSHTEHRTPNRKEPATLPQLLPFRWKEHTLNAPIKTWYAESPIGTYWIVECGAALGGSYHMSLTPNAATDWRRRSAFTLEEAQQACHLHCTHFLQKFF